MMDKGLDADDDEHGNQSEATESSEDEDLEKLTEKRARKERMLAERNQKTENVMNKQE